MLLVHHQGAIDSFLIVFAVRNAKQRPCLLLHFRPEPGLHFALGNSGITRQQFLLPGGCMPLCPAPCNSIGRLLKAGQNIGKTITTECSTGWSR